MQTNVNPMYLCAYVVQFALAFILEHLEYWLTLTTHLAYGNLYETIVLPFKQFLWRYACKLLYFSYKMRLVAVVLVRKKITFFYAVDGSPEAQDVAIFFER